MTFYRTKASSFFPFNNFSYSFSELHKLPLKGIKVHSFHEPVIWHMLVPTVCLTNSSPDLKPLPSISLFNNLSQHSLLHTRALQFFEDEWGQNPEELGASVTRGQKGCQLNVTLSTPSSLQSHRHISRDSLSLSLPIGNRLCALCQALNQMLSGK